MIDIFVTVVYQPFLNLLIGIYWLLNQIPNITADMGVAVIIFTIALRFLLLPLTVSANRSAAERRQIEDKVKELKKAYPHQPIQLKKEIRRVFHTNPGVVAAELFNLSIQIIIALMLWRIFAKGLKGEDLHLLYNFMPQIDQPLQLKFLGIYDLTKPNLVLNLLQSIAIFAVETMSLITSPFPVTREEIIRLQFVLPVVSFIIFLNLPAGKKLFIITSLLFTLTYTVIRQLRYWAYQYFPPPTKETKEKEVQPA